MINQMIKKYPKLYVIIRSVIVFLLFWFSAYFQYIPIRLFHIQPHTASKTIQVLLSTFSSAILFFIFLFIYWKDVKKEFKKFTKHFMENMDIGVRWWMIGLFIMMVSNVMITYFFKAGGAGNEKIVQDMLDALPWLMLIDAGILAPFNEEIAFRKTLKDVFSNKWLFVFLSFLLFGGGHVIGNATQFVDYLYIIPYGALGGAFALAYYETDTIFTSLSLHMFHNTVLVLLSILVL